MNFNKIQGTKNINTDVVITNDTIAVFEQGRQPEGAPDDFAKCQEKNDLLVSQATTEKEELETCF